jgi:hypothetical protein
MKPCRIKAPAKGAVLEMENPSALSQKLLESLGHVPRYTSKSTYDPSVSILRWASNNLPDELIHPALAYVTKVCGANTWDQFKAAKHLKNYAHTWSQALPMENLRLPTLIGTNGRSMGLMRSEVNDPPFVDTWRGIQQSASNLAQKDLLKNHIVALDDCLHTGHTVLKELALWKDSIHPNKGFVVQIVSLSAHVEGIDEIRKWTQEQGGALLAIENEGQIRIPGIGKVIPRFSVRSGQRFPWSIVPGSDFEKAALQYPEIVSYLHEKRQGGRSLENFTEEQSQKAQPHPDDVLGAVGLLLIGVRSYRLGLDHWSATTGIRPMGYVQEWDSLKRHHELGFGSPFTSWLGVPNTAPLGLWAGPPLVKPPSLFVRKRMDSETLRDMESSPQAPSDSDDLPF